MAGPWYYDSAVGGGTGTGLSWANARTSLATMTSVVAGDFIYVAHTHAEAPGSALTITFPGTAANPNHVICVNKAGSVPPIDADWRTTASVGTTGTFSISIVGSAYIQGITFDAGIGSTGVVTLSVDQATGGTAGNWQHFENCTLKVSSTNNTNSTRVTIGQSGTTVGNRCILTNTGIWLSRLTHSVSPSCGQIEWRNTAAPFPAFVPTTVVAAYGTPFNWVFEGVNFGGIGGFTFFGAATTHFRAAFYGCNMGGMTPSATITHPSVEIYVSGSGPPSAPFISYESRYTQDGTEITDAQVARVGGASDGATPFSRSLWVFNTVNLLDFRPYVGVPLVKWNDVTGADLTLTVYGICTIGGSLPDNGDIWLEAHYFADTFAASRSPLMAIDHNGRKPNFQSASTNHTADTSDWTAGTVPARANSTAYTLTSIIKVASNPGRLFAPVGAGTTAASEPAGFASCIDGATVADGSVLWRALNRFKMTITLNSPQPQLAGPVYLFVKTPSYSAIPVIWVDPEIG